jgi:signal transduction histidine kinase
MQETADHLRSFVAAQDASPADPARAAAQRQAGAEAIRRLQEAIRRARQAAAEAAPTSQPQTQPASGAPTRGGPYHVGLASLQALEAVRSYLAEPEHEARDTIKGITDDIEARQKRVASLRQEAQRSYRTNLIVVCSIAALSIAWAVILSVWQYRGVMHPLHHLRAGVRSITRGRFQQRLDARGDTEFVELSRDFNQMAEELETLYGELAEEINIKSKELVRSERLASVGFLAAGIAHEINNPLGIITGYAELAQRHLGKSPTPQTLDETGKALRIICDEAYRCKRIIEKLLELAKPGAQGKSPWGQGQKGTSSGGGGDSGGEVVDLASAANDTALMVAGLPRFRGRKLEVRLDKSQDLHARANAIEVKQVLLNLTVNALEAVSPGSGLVWIEGRPVADSSGRWVELIVADNGRGMSPWTLEHVFEPFFTDRRGKAADPAPGAAAPGMAPTGGPAPGSEPAEAGAADWAVGADAGASPSGIGLGLSIVHAIILSHGGHIHAYSDGVGRGSRFVVRLPAA